ncbi:hypothetical protein ACOSQ4_020569 [Xanthoceras sorbifolium]
MDSPRNNLTVILGKNLTVCGVMKEDGDVYSGLWSGMNPTDYVFSFFMFQIILSFFISRLLHFLLRPLKQPKFVCDMLTGFILGPSVLGRDKSMLEKIFLPKNMLLSNTISTIGAIYFVFITSVKIDKSRIFLTVKKAWNVSLTCLVIPCIISTSLFYLLQNFLTGFYKVPHFYLYLGFGMSLCHSPNVAHALGELNLLNPELGQLALFVVVLHSIIGGLHLATLMFAIPGAAMKTSLFQLCMSALIAFIVFTVLRPLMLWIVKNTPEGKPVKSIYVRLILVAPLITAMLSDAAGTHFLTGAQIMGLIIPAGPPLGSALVEKSELIMSELLLPFFFIHVGQRTNVQMITDLKAFWALIFILMVQSISKMIGSVRNAILLSFILNFKGVIDHSVFLWLRMQKLVDDSYFTAFVLSTVAVNAIMNPLIQIFYKPELSLEACPSFENYPRSLQSMPSIGELRVLCCIHCGDNVNGMITLLKASNPTEFSPICAYTLYLTQLIGQAAPLLAPYETKKGKWKTNSSDRIMHALLRFSKTLNVPLTIQPLKIIAPYKTMHETICKLAIDKFIPLIIAPFPESLEFHGKKASLRSFNINIQTYAPCTVGILVDRSSHHLLSTTNFSYNVLAIFLGGPDDREALALVLRMSGHPGVSITLIRIDFKADDDNNKSERYLDECFINEFKSRTIGNASVVCHEVVAEETAQVMNVISKVDNSYDLVIVGKQPGANSRLAKEMLPWIEYKELGVIGDMVASSDFCGGTMSVLVMQCFRISSTGIESSMTNYDERSLKKAWNVNLTCLVAPFIISTSLFYLLQKYLTGFYNAPLFYLYLGFATSLSHCLNVTHALGELNLLNSELGQLAFNINVCNSRASMKLCLSQLCIVFTVLHPLMLWIIKNTPEGKPVKSMYVRLILVAPLITAMLTEAAGTTFFTRAQMMGLIIPKSELIMSELFLPFFFIHKVFWALIFILIVESFSKMIGSLSSLLCVNTSVWNAILLSFILNFKGVIEHNVFLWLRMQKLVDDSYFTAFVLSIVAVNAIMSPLIQIFYKPELRLEDCLSFGNHPRRLHSMPSTSELRVLCCIHCEYNVNGMRAWCHWRYGGIFSLLCEENVCSGNSVFWN